MTVLGVRYVGMYIATVPNRNSPPAILLRESYRENGKVKTRTLANLSKPDTLAIGGTDEDDLYGAMDWLLGHQDAIERNTGGAPPGQRRPRALRPECSGVREAASGLRTSQPRRHSCFLTPDTRTPV